MRRALDFGYTRPIEPFDGLLIPRADRWQPGDEALYVWPPQPFDAPQGVKWVALDVEEWLEYRIPVTREDIDYLKAQGVQPVIYTSRYEWGVVMGGSEEFADVPLWDAAYTGLTPWQWPTDVQLGFVPYGGWTKRFGWQFKGTTSYLGGSVDLNIFEDMEEDMDPVQLARAKALNEAQRINLLGGDIRDLGPEDGKKLVELADAWKAGY